MSTLTLRELRKSKGVTQADLATRLNLTPAAIHRIEDTGTTLVTTLEAYAKGINCDFIDVWRSSIATRKAASTPQPPVKNS